MNVLICALVYTQVHFTLAQNAVALAVDLIARQQLQPGVRVALRVQNHSDVLALIFCKQIRNNLQVLARFHVEELWKG